VALPPAVALPDARTELVAGSENWRKSRVDAENLTAEQALAVTIVRMDLVSDHTD